jgi:hypothetical protein
VRWEDSASVKEPVTLAYPTVIRTWGEFGFNLSLWRFTFLNYTKSAKYEALEKNAVQATNRLAHRSRVRFGFLERPNFIVDLRLSRPGRKRMTKSLAEGVQPGSNILLVAHRTRAGGSVSVGIKIAVVP